MTLASCLCPTYGRCPDYQHLLEECVQSFVLQDYPHKELVILNDCPGQELACEAHGVRVVNWPVRLSSLGAKYNLLVSLARGDVLLPWEDDDLALPWRVSQAVRLLGGAGYWNPQRSWFLDGGVLSCTHKHGVCHNAGAFTRGAWLRAGGYPPASGAQDALMDRTLKQSVPVAAPLGDDPQTWAYVYRWGVSPVHLSGDPDPEARYRAEGKETRPGGRFVLKPHWRRDYAALCKQACEVKRAGR